MFSESVELTPLVCEVNKRSCHIQSQFNEVVVAGGIILVEGLTSPKLRHPEIPDALRGFISSDTLSSFPSIFTSFLLWF